MGDSSRFRSTLDDKYRQINLHALSIGIFHYELFIVYLSLKL